MRSGSYDQAKLIQISAFLDHDWGHVAVHPRWPHVLITKLRDIHNFKSLAPLQRFAWCIASLVLQLLKPSLNCRLANSLVRKMWIRFLEKLIMLSNGFYKRRHIGSSCKLIDNLKTVEFYTLKTSQFKKGTNTDSIKNTLSIQYLHRSLCFTF